MSPDVWRYFLLLRRPETSDTEFEWDGFIAANNNELVANFGNFVNRVLKFVNSANYDSVIPAWPKDSLPEEVSAGLKKHLVDTNEKLKQYITEMDGVHLKGALIVAREISSLGNLLLQSNKLDNALFTNERARCDAVVNIAVQHIHLLASVIAPYLPLTTKAILSQLQTELLIIPDDWKAESIPAGHKIGKAAHLFKNIKPEQAQVWKEMFGGDELKKAKEEEAKKKAARKADKDKKKAKKAAERAANAEGVGAGVEASARDGVEAKAQTGDAVDAVTDGVKQVTLPTS